jgi:hypothetical protein
LDCGLLDRFLLDQVEIAINTTKLITAIPPIAPSHINVRLSNGWLTPSAKPLGGGPSAIAVCRSPLKSPKTGADGGKLAGQRSKIWRCFSEFIEVEPTAASQTGSPIEGGPAVGGPAVGGSAVGGAIVG